MLSRLSTLGGMLILLAVNGCAEPMCDLVIVNARVWTGNPAQPEAQAIAIEGDRIVAVGTDEKVREKAGPATRLLDAGGKRVIPGLIDCHTHIVGAGLQLARLHLRDVGGRGEFVTAVAEAARAKRPGQWVLGGRWSVESWPNPEPPTKEWIDPATGDVPVFLERMDGHQALANSAALKLAGIDATGPPDPSGGEIERDPDTGQPTGILKDDAMELVDRHIPPISAEQRRQALLRAMEQANRYGVTSVHDMSGPADLDCFERVREAGDATVRIRSFIMAEEWAPYFKTANDFDNDDWVTVAGFKGFMDGSLGSRTAFMHEPYSDAAADEKYPQGLLVGMAEPPEKLCRQIAEADRRGFQVVVHAIGDRANSILLHCYESVEKGVWLLAQSHCRQQETPPARCLTPFSTRRHRVEHAQHLTKTDIPRFKELGVVASMQPLHKADDGRYAEDAIGPDRIKTSYAYRSLLDSGAALCFGSDWPVVSVNPFEGIAAAVTARTIEGQVWLPQQSISVAEALRAYTANAAYAGFSEDRLGSIEPGKLADIVILDRDPFNTPPDELGQVTATHTIVGGRVVWSVDAPDPSRDREGAN